MSRNCLILSESAMSKPDQNNNQAKFGIDSLKPPKNKRNWLKNGSKSSRKIWSAQSVKEDQSPSKPSKNSETNCSTPKKHFPTNLSTQSALSKNSNQLISPTTKLINASSKNKINQKRLFPSENTMLWLKSMKIYQCPMSPYSAPSTPSKKASKF